MDYIACQALLSMGFSRQEYWSGLPWPPPGNPSDPGIKPMSLMSLKLAANFFTTSATWKDIHTHTQNTNLTYVYIYIYIYMSHKYYLQCHKNSTSISSRLNGSYNQFWSITQYNYTNIESGMMLGLMEIFSLSHYTSSDLVSPKWAQRLETKCPSHTISTIPQSIILDSVMSISQLLDSQNSRQIVRLLEDWQTCSLILVILWSEALKLE